MAHQRFFHGIQLLNLHEFATTASKGSARWKLIAYKLMNQTTLQAVETIWISDIDKVHFLLFGVSRSRFIPLEIKYDANICPKEQGNTIIPLCIATTGKTAALTTPCQKVYYRVKHTFFWFAKS